MNKKIPKLSLILKRPKGSFLKSSQGSVAIFLVFLLAVNYLAAQSSFYLDMTQDKIYTASPASKDILGKLEKPVTVTFYISKDLPSNSVLFKTQVQDVLNQYEDLSKGKLKIKYETPDNETATVQGLVAKGIPQLQSEVVEKDKVEVKNFFFGAIVSSGEGDGAKTEVLPSVTVLESFEYDLVSAVYSVSRENKDTIALLQGHGEKTIATSDLAKSYTIKNVNISTEEGKKGFYVAVAAPATTETSAATPATPAEKEFVEPKTVIIAGPTSNLSEAEIAVLDEFVAKGGKVVLMSEKINIDAQQGFVTKKIENNANDFTKKYGIEINGNLVYDKLNSPISYSAGNYYLTKDYPYWVEAVKDNFSSHPSLSKIKTLTFLWVSSLKIENKEGYEVKNLVTSSSAGETVSENITIAPDANLSFLSGGKETLAAISTAQSGGGQVIVIGDSDFVSPVFMQPIPDNEIFFTNLIESVSSSANLSSIRTKNISARPIKELTDSEKGYWKFLAIGGGAIIISVYGFVRIGRRKKKSRG